MSIDIKLKPSEIALVDILRHPVLGPEFVRNFNLIPDTENGSFDTIWKERHINQYYTHTDYQRLMLCDFNQYVVFCTARAVGKTEVLIDKLVSYLLNLPYFWKDEYIVLLAPNKVHIDPIFRKLSNWFRTNDFLRYLVDRKSINIANFNIKLLTGATLDGRIAGTSGTGANVVGLHTPFMLYEEAAYFPWGTWQESLRCLNDWIVGSQVIVAGVPDGRRERSVLYHVDQKDPLFTSHRVPSHRNPRWTEESELRALEQFGGPESEDYKHMVLGEHGAPVWAIFDRALMFIDNYDTYIKIAYNENIKSNPQYIYKQILEIPPLPKTTEDCIFGIDLGYTEPTAILVLYMINGVWKIHARLNWYQISYDMQEQLIMFLVNKFNPSLVGMDEGSSGKAVIQHLLSDEKYKNKQLNSILIPINFSASIPIGIDENGNEIKTRAKEFSVPYLQTIANTHRIAFSKNDEDLIIELERTTYTKTPAGHMVFKTYTIRGSDRGSDHNLSALLAAFLAWYLEHESNYIHKSNVKLLKPRWIL